MKTQERYIDIQNVMVAAGETGCLFLSLLTIAEDYLRERGESTPDIDFINAYRNSIRQGYLKTDFTCLNQTAMLEMWTGKKWTRTIMKELPIIVPDNMYTIAHWKNGLTDHFRRRSFDVYHNSKTVRKGKLVEYYCYEVE